MIDRRDHVSVACKLFGEIGVLRCVRAQPGREEDRRKALCSRGHRRAGESVSLIEPSSSVSGPSVLLKAVRSGKYLAGSAVADASAGYHTSTRNSRRSCSSGVLGSPRALSFQKKATLPTAFGPVGRGSCRFVASAAATTRANKRHGEERR